MIRIELCSPLDRNSLYAVAKWLRRHWREATDPAFIDLPFVRALVRAALGKPPAETVQQETSYGIIEELRTGGWWRVARIGEGKVRHTVVDVLDGRRTETVLRIRVK